MKFLEFLNNSLEAFNGMIFAAVAVICVSVLGRFYISIVNQAGKPFLVLCVLKTET